MAEGTSIKLSGVIFAVADHPDCGVDEWDVEGERLLRVNFNYRRDPVGPAMLRERDTVDS